MTFFPSSSILYSVTVFIFPLMVSLGDGRVPVRNTNKKPHWDFYCWFIINPRSWVMYSQYLNNSIYTKVHSFWNSITLTLPTSLKAHSVCRQCFHLRNHQLTPVCQMYTVRLKKIQDLKVHIDVRLNKSFITTWDRLTGLFPAPY